MPLTFIQEIWLAVVDKLALGGSLVGVGYVANRYLESHKIRQAFASEVAKQRLAAIGEVWQALGEYELEAYRAAGRGHLVLLQELGKAGAPLPDPIPRDTQQVLRAISKVMNSVELSAEAVARVETWIAENARETHEHADRVMSKIAAKRFLVGDELAASFEGYLGAIHSSYRLLGPSPESAKAYQDSRQELKRLRSDIEATSKVVFG